MYKYDRKFALNSVKPFLSCNGKKEDGKSANVEKANKYPKENNNVQILYFLSQILDLFCSVGSYFIQFLY